MKVSLVIPTHNRREQLRHCLSAALRQDYPDYEVIVVDDASSDDTASMVQQQFPQIIYLRQATNQGPAAARNRGIAVAQGAIIAFTDDDCIVPPNFLSRLADGLARYPQAGGVGGYQEAAEQVLATRLLARHERYLSRVVYGAGDSEYLGGVESPACGTNNIAYRREVLELVGGFAKIPVAAGEDALLRTQVVERGYRMLYIPLKVVHTRSYELDEFWRQQVVRGKGVVHYELLRHGRPPTLARMALRLAKRTLRFVPTALRSGAEIAAVDTLGGWADVYGQYLEWRAHQRRSQHADLRVSRRYRLLRGWVRRHLVNPYPQAFAWLPPLMRLAYGAPLPVAVLNKLPIVEKLLMPDTLYVTTTIEPEGLRLRLRPADRIQGRIYYEGAFEPHLVALFRRYLRPGTAVVDVGAHCGQYALLASQTAEQVLAFEPDAANVADLRANAAANGITNLHVFNAAVADHVGLLPLFADDDNFGFANHSLARGAGVFEGRAETVQAVTLDSLLLALRLPVSLIKLDIEGAELLALRGATGILRRDRPALLLEVDARWTASFGYRPRDARRFLEELGYHCYHIGTDGHLRLIAAGDEETSWDWAALPVTEVSHE